ncbi:NADH-ubiquinone oxidoreductase chain C [hydrothermal vent metagenome]|uniref:NADH-ubiquinone oxidoreductase chain C n=1 Tax=hydrothermal vent metagenome TaxID=652676 RepID=A0A3B1BMZ4_9ZZZZ
MIETGTGLGKTVAKLFAKTKTIIHTHNQCGDETVVVRAEDILDVMAYLRDSEEMKFDLMMDLTAVDYLNDPDLQPYLRKMKTRFEVVYHLYSMEKNHRLRVKVPLAEDKLEINSVTSLWRGADWFEREAFDLYGVKFLGHPNLKRILLYEEFKGHPLRKDYPKTKRQPLIGPRN